MQILTAPSQNSYPSDYATMSATKPLLLFLNWSLMVVLIGNDEGKRK